jgi:hypothetical protein
LGYVDHNGTVYNAIGHRLGYVDPNGTVYDAIGDLLGYVDPPFAREGGAALLLIFLERE